MLEFKNQTPFQAMITPAMDENFNEFIVVIVKATYQMTNSNENLKLSDEQLPVLLSDIYYDEPGNSSLKEASDVATFKLGTDILLEGCAYNFHGTNFVDTHLQVGATRKNIRVFGRRFWEKLHGGWQISMPERFETLPMIFENAYGGTELSENKQQTKFEERNPVGKGYYHKNDDRNLEGFELPNLENSENLISHWRDRVNPVVYAAIAPHWAPRKLFSGTYDENWEKKRKPYLPMDFNERFFNVASTDMISSEYLQGGETVELNNLSKERFTRFVLPSQNFRLRYSMKSKNLDAPSLNLDTLVIKPEENRISLTWRTKILCNRQFLYCDRLSLKLAS